MRKQRSQRLLTSPLQRRALRHSTMPSARTTSGVAAATFPKKYTTTCAWMCAQRWRHLAGNPRHSLCAAQCIMPAAVSLVSMYRCPTSLEACSITGVARATTQRLPRTAPGHLQQRNKFCTWQALPCCCSYFWQHEPALH